MLLPFHAASPMHPCRCLPLCRTVLPAGEHAFAGALPDPRVPEQCPQAVLELYKQCTAPDPSDRPTAREVEERLNELGRLAGTEG